MGEGDDRTIGELARQIEGMRRDFHGQFSTMHTQLARLVSLEYLGQVEGRLAERVADVAKDIADEKGERKSDIASIRSFQRYLVGIVIAVAAIIIPLAFNLQGGP